MFIPLVAQHLSGYILDNADTQKPRPVGSYDHMQTSNNIPFCRSNQTGIARVRITIEYVTGDYDVMKIHKTWIDDANKFVEGHDYFGSICADDGRAVGEI